MISWKNFANLDGKCKLCKYGTLQAPNLELHQSFRVIQHCIKFLVKHSDMVGSQEVHHIADILTAMYSKELNEVNKYLSFAK